MSSKNDGAIIILSSPSGAGKTTLVKLLSQRKNFNISVSHTTREPRSNEIEGKDYFFINNKEFENLIKNNQFLYYHIYFFPTHLCSLILQLSFCHSVFVKSYLLSILIQL